ncbi:MAG: peptide chain release factor 1 [Planctomycetes bacterium]|nr:peptide chain release factor 1 [Planctomycetota bacterium]MBL7007522.1 peptide chain release factor 1 [Planctomycetota bacterium]
MRERLAALEARHRELQAQVVDPTRASRPDYPDLLREMGTLEKVLGPWTRYQDLERQIAEAEEMAAAGDDELRVLAEEELPALREQLDGLTERILDRALEEDDDGGRAAIVEIRAGAGGDEAALFARDLFEVYHRFGESRRWKFEVMDSSESDMGGFKEISFKVSGEEVFRALRYESGGHRVQRVPKTETQGRIHTSAATVAVLPEVAAVDFELKSEDLEITAMRSSGPGGQSVNKTSSAIRVVHIPTGEAVKCQEGKSQLQNKERAIALLRSRLYDREKAKRDAERADLRKSQVGSGDRSQRIRTYNYPQNRVTDHRLGRNFSLEVVLEGRLDELVEALAAADRAAKLAAL